MQYDARKWTDGQHLRIHTKLYGVYAGRGGNYGVLVWSAKEERLADSQQYCELWETSGITNRHVDFVTEQLPGVCYKKSYVSKRTYVY